MATLAELKGILADHFGAAPVRTASLRLMSAGLIPQGNKGRCGSAEIEPRHAALVVLALAATAWSAPVECPQEARRLGSFALSFPKTADPPPLLPVLAGELRRAASPDHMPGAWHVGEHSVRRIVDTGRHVLIAGQCVPHDDAWTFSAPSDRVAMPVDARGRPLAALVNRSTEVSVELIRAIGQLFAPVGVAAAAD